MLGINIQGEFLDLSPGTSMQLERQSPFFNINDLAGEYTLPITLPYTPRNARLIGLQNHHYTKREKIKISSRLYDKNNFAYTGDLVIESVDLNVNDITKSKVNGYFLMGVSSFFQSIRNKKLKELYLGGVRNFAWTNENPNSLIKGFWQHVHETLTVNYHYTFDPIRNEKWAGNNDPGTPEWMNKLDVAGNIDFENNYNTLCPQVSLQYLLQQICEEHGWTFDSSGMNDDQWSTLYIPSFYAVTWQKIVDTPSFGYSPLTNISINLQNHVPPEMLITELILAVRNRYNWGFDFNSSARVVSMFPLKELSNGERKDWTKYMNPKWKSSFADDKKIFAFKNEIDSNDSYSSAPDFTKIIQGSPVEEYSDLPAPAEANFNQVVYVWKDNRYYQVRYNEDDNVYEWGIFADNIYNHEPTSYNEEITTVASTMPVYKTLYRTNSGTDYYGLFPLCEQEGNWEGKVGDFIPWGLRLLFHRGRVYEATVAGSAGPVLYPYLTSLPWTITQTEPDLEWSNVYIHAFDGVDKGIIKKWFSDTLKYLEQSDVMVGTLNLPRQELLNFSWSDVILLRNIPYIAEKLTEVIPYNSTVKSEMRRIG